jgi:type II secretory pathway pseudopilin PulG
MARDRRPRQSGIGLIEALLALAAIGFALTALLRLQMVMQDGTVRERRRLDALLAVQSLHERLRAGQVDAPVGDDDGLTLETLDRDGPFGLRQRRSSARWQVRPGVAEAVTLDTLLPADPDLDATWSTLVVLDRTPPRVDATGQARLVPRSSLIPKSATPLGDGRSAWQPNADSPTVWLIDEASGAVLARCAGMSGGTSGPRPTDCVAVGGFLLDGVVRFATDTDQPGAAEVDDPRSPALPLGLAMRPAAASQTAPETACAVDGPASMPDPSASLPPGSVRYRCVVAGNGTPPRWSGRLEIVPKGWTLGTVDSPPPAAPVRRVCRYSVDQDRDGHISNAEHPAVYLAVDGPLGDQNFLVVRAGASCPVGVASRPWAADLGPPPTTAPHQPT